jgi:hypothetical protein
MNTEQIAEIHAALRRALEGAPDICVTLEVTGQRERWMQIVDFTVNAAYPHTMQPEEMLKTLPRLAGKGEIVSWEPGKFATFQFHALEPDSLTKWIDAYFVGILDCVPGEYHLDVACDDL